MPETTKCEGKDTSAGSETGTTEQKKLKPCCACPETKRPRDKWLVYLKNKTKRILSCHY